MKAHGVDLQKARAEVEKLVRPEADVVIKGKLATTPEAKRVIEYAIDEARRVDLAYVGTEHLLLGLLRDKEGLASQILKRFGATLEEVRSHCVLQLAEGGKEEAKTGGVAPDRLESIFTLAREEVGKTGCDTMHPEHLLLGLLRENPEHTTEIVRAAAESLDVAREKVRQLLQQSASPTTPSAQATAGAKKPPMRGKKVDLEELKLTIGYPRRYVNRLLLDLANRGGGEVTLRQSQPLPVPPKGGMEGVDFEHVINRLKIMANVNPVLAPRPVEGRIELVVNDAPFTVELHFDDHAADRFCRLRVVKGSG